MTHSNYVHEEYVDNVTREKYASFVSKAVFSWFDGFAWTGWRRVLQYDDLWNLDYENRSVSLQLMAICANRH